MIKHKENVRKNCGKNGRKTIGIYVRKYVGTLTEKTFKGTRKKTHTEEPLISEKNKPQRNCEKKSQIK
jgi:hypothetical protein